MSKQNALDYRHGRQGGRIVPWRRDDGETVATIVARQREQAERDESRGQQLDLFADEEQP